MKQPHIDEEPWKGWIGSDKDALRRCTLGIRHVSLGRIADHFAEHYPDVDLRSVELTGGCLYWEQPPTQAELDDLARQQREHRERVDAWERETYARLKAKFEPVGALETTD